MFRLKHFILSLLFKIFYSSLIKEMEVALKETYLFNEKKLSNDIESISFNGEMLGYYHIGSSTWLIAPYHKHNTYGGKCRVTKDKKYTVHYIFYN